MHLCESTTSALDSASGSVLSSSEALNTCALLSKQPRVQASRRVESGTAAVVSKMPYVLNLFMFAWSARIGGRGFGSHNYPPEVKTNPVWIGGRDFGSHNYPPDVKTNPVWIVFLYLAIVRRKLDFPKRSLFKSERAIGCLTITSESHTSLGIHTAFECDYDTNFDVAALVSLWIFCRSWT